MDSYGIAKRLELLIGTMPVRAFARKCNIGEATIRGYLDESRYPRQEVASKIAEACGTTIEWIYSGKLPDIRTLDNSTLKKLCDLDPEVIDYEEENGKLCPVVSTYDDEEYNLVFYCIHCRAWHSHGRGGKEYPYSEGRGGMAGDRNVHCAAQNSPFLANGVILDVVGKFSAANKSNRKAYPELLCPKCKNHYSAAFNACQCGYVNKKRETKHKELSSTYLQIAFDTENPSNITRKKTTKTSTTDPNTIATNNQPSLVSITYIEENYASAGAGIINYDAAKEVMHFDRNFLVSQFGPTNFENVHIIHAVGDSMSPTIASGDMLFVNPGDKDVTTGAVYVFVIGEETLVKRAERNPLSGELTLRSDNKEYAPIEIATTDLNKVSVVGRVIGNFKKF